MITYIKKLLISIKESLEFYAKQFIKGPLQVRVGMIADVLQIVTYTAIVSALVTVLEFTYLTKFIFMFFIGLIIVIFMVILLIVFQPINRILEKNDNPLLTVFITVLYFVIGIYGLGVVSTFFYTNLQPMITHLKSSLL